jgi:hypothetical protein
MTRHPEGKIGVNVSQQKYDLVREAILDSLQTHGERTLEALIEDVRSALQGKFDGSIRWYVATVERDLEAREIVQQTEGTIRQRLGPAQD